MVASQPNILLITTCRHPADSLSCYSNALCKTPNIDSLGIQGMRFDEAFIGTTVCSQARAWLMTGRLPRGHDVPEHHEPVLTSPPGPAAMLTWFSRYMVQQRYRCGHVGKWHMGTTGGPEESGFEGCHYAGRRPPVRHPDYERYLKERDLPRFSFSDEMRNTLSNGRPGTLIGATLNGPVEMTWPYFLAERTIERLALYAATVKPFFLHCSFFAPQPPHILPGEYRHAVDPRLIPAPSAPQDMPERTPHKHRSSTRHGRFEHFTSAQWQEMIAMFYGSVMAVDDQVGRILAALEEFSLAENTLVVFTADHGGSIGDRRLSDMGRAQSHDKYRIPLLARCPGLVRPNTVCHADVHLVNLMATFIDAYGGPIPEFCNGRSILPLLRGESPAD